MELERVEAEGWVIYRLKGRIDAVTAQGLELALAEGLPSAENMLLNLGGVDYVSSGGLKVMLAAEKEKRKRGGRMLLCCLTGSVYEIFKLSGLLTMMEIYDNEAAAIGSDQAV